MTIGDKVTNRKLQYDTNNEAAKISALSSGEIDKYENFTGEEILPPDQGRIIEQARFTYSPLGKNLLGRIWKLIMTIGDKFRDKHCNMILIMRLQIYQHSHLVKSINSRIVQVKKYYLLTKVE